MSLMDWIGFVTGIICVWLIVREKDINWPIGLLNSVALLVVFWVQKLYAQAGLQAFYIAECAYGWWLWTRIDEKTGVKIIRIGRTRRQTLNLLALLGVVGIVAVWPIFRITGDPAPLADSVVTVMSLIAEYMLCLKFLEAWGVFRAAELFSLAILAALGMWITFGTYLCFTVLCVIGILEWRKRMKNNSVPELSLASSIP